MITSRPYWCFAHNTGHYYPIFSRNNIFFLIPTLNLRIQSNVQVAQNQKMSYQAKSCLKLTIKTRDSQTDIIFSKSTVETPLFKAMSFKAMPLLLTLNRFHIILVFPVTLNKENAGQVISLTLRVPILQKPVY